MKASTLSKSAAAAAIVSPSTFAASIGSLGIEPTTQAFLQAVHGPGGPGLETLSPAAARAVLTGAQAGFPRDQLAPADVSEKTIEADGRRIALTVVRPAGVPGLLPGFIFVHGGGWVLGDYPTHERFVRDLVAESGAVAVFVNYTPSPEARFPVAIEEIYSATRWVAAHGDEIGVDGSRLAVAGNSVGGNMSAVLALLAQERGGPALRAQVLFWPVTDATFNDVSYRQFAEGHFLTRPMMQWFWDNYTTDEDARDSIHASPLRASISQLRGLPPALVQTAEFDVLRDEGEAYARKLQEAGVDVTAVRYNGTIHDFGLLNALSQTPATKAALRQAAAELRRRLQ
jgi:acetyl esterase/lipase